MGQRVCKNESGEETVTTKKKKKQGVVLLVGLVEETMLSLFGRYVIWVVVVLVGWFEWWW